MRGSGKFLTLEPADVEILKAALTQAKAGKTGAELFNTDRLCRLLARTDAVTLQLDNGHRVESICNVERSGRGAQR